MSWAPSERLKYVKFTSCVYGVAWKSFINAETFSDVPKQSNIVPVQKNGDKQLSEIMYQCLRFFAALKNIWKNFV